MLKEAHYKTCKAEGMTDDQIEKDWESFISDYEEWLDEQDAAPEPEETGSAKCEAAARSIGLLRAYAETCEDCQYGCPGCPFKK